MNKDFWKAPDGPVFLFIGGEGGLTESTVMEGICNTCCICQIIHSKGSIPGILTEGYCIHALVIRK